mmetsp:Transcript_104400/g.302029  ORF Transcript_104400/g.302029 Transcript_104400/m.302029 type:complete len:92 (-) Transcript_104400:277-552(-)
MGAVDDDTTLVTMVRDLQLADDIPSDPALCDDVPMDIVCTPTRTLRIDMPLPKPSGVNWDKLSPEEESQKLMRKGHQQKSHTKAKRDAMHD